MYEYDLYEVDYPMEGDFDEEPTVPESVDFHPEMQRLLDWEDSFRALGHYVLPNTNKVCVQYSTGSEIIQAVIVASRLDRIRWGLEPDPYFENSTAEFIDNDFLGRKSLEPEEESSTLFFDDQYEV